MKAPRSNDFSRYVADPVQHNPDRLASSTPVNHRDLRRQDASLRGAADLHFSRDGGLQQEPVRAAFHLSPIKFHRATRA